MKQVIHTRDRRTLLPGLSVLLACRGDAQPPRTPKILLGRTFSESLHSLMREFDVIVVDTSVVPKYFEVQFIAARLPLPSL